MVPIHVGIHYNLQQYVDTPLIIVLASGCQDKLNELQGKVNYNYKWIEIENYSKKNNYKLHT